MAFEAPPQPTLPPLPDYTLKPLPSVIPGVEDKYLTLALPVIAYWVYSMFFHLLDVYDLFPQFRLHTPAEITKRNHASRLEVVRDVIVQQVIQTIVGLAIAHFDPPQWSGQDDYNIAIWAQRIRLAERALPGVLAAFGLDSKAWSRKVSANNPTLAGALNGGSYPDLYTTGRSGAETLLFAAWELNVASAIYWYLVPFAQFAFVIIIVDTWQYFIHRAMHMNRWLYTTIHSRHHRLYVPYAYGALYNHPLEALFLDTCGTGLAYVLAGLSPRQAMWFFTGTTLKTVDDHCGYALPFDLLQHLTGNNAAYHDVHHQSWGIKANFSQPFFTFWDRLLGTTWKGGDVSARYERSRLAAARQLDSDALANRVVDPSLPGETDMKAAKFQAQSSKEQVLHESWEGARPLKEEAEEEEREARRLANMRKTTHKRKRTAENQASNLQGLRERVSSVGEGFRGTVMCKDGQ